MLALDDGVVSDLHKDAYGCRPGEAFWSAWECMTIAEKKQRYIELCHSVEDAIAEEAREAEEAAVEFEQLVFETIAHGAADRQTAIRWLQDASNWPTDWIGFCYEYGLPGRYFYNK